MKRAGVIFLFFLVYSGMAISAVVGEEVDYRDGTTVLKGYLAYDNASKERRPGILVVHEWWGHNAHARNRARMLAKLGYTALAVDMYGDGKQANHPKDAGRFASAVSGNMKLAKARFMAALNLLNKHATVDKNRMAAIGFCFGGGIVLNMARQGLDLDGVVSFHGSITTTSPAKKGVVKARILVLNGADDPFTTAGDIEKFKKEMASAGVNYRFVNYPGARHSFTNPEADRLAKKFNLPLGYNSKADKQSWKEMQKFFKEIFK